MKKVVYHVDEPRWYNRLTAPVHLSWRREVAWEGALLVAGLLLGLWLGRG